MSYIFNNFSSGEEGGPSFSSVVAVAREKGYTVGIYNHTDPHRDVLTIITQEPHPADDLTGSDVARKLTILARFIPSLREKVPLPQGYQSVPTTSLIPAGLDAQALSADDFVTRLAEYDAEYNQKRSDALKEGSVLRYVGVVDLEKGIVKADLQKYVFYLVEMLQRSSQLVHSGTPKPTPSQLHWEVRITLSCSTRSATARGLLSSKELVLVQQ